MEGAPSRSTDRELATSAWAKVTDVAEHERCETGCGSEQRSEDLPHRRAATHESSTVTAAVPDDS